MNILNDIFSSTLKNELKTVTYKGESYNCFFRRNDTSNDNAYTTVYFPVDKYLSRGATFSYGLDNYIIIKNLTSENDVYRKVQAIKCNNSFKVIYAKNEIIEYKCFMNDLSNSLNTKGGSITIDSNIQFMLELNSDSKRLKINKRFFCGFKGLAWVIREINYIDGLCYIYCERSPINSDDDIENGIADRWYYSTIIDNYKVTTTSNSYSLTKSETMQIGSKLYKNGEEIDNTLIHWTIADPTICSIANDTITALETGTTTVEGEYKANDSDVCENVSLTIEIIEAKPLHKTLSVNPLKNNLRQGKILTITCKVIDDDNNIIDQEITYSCDWVDDNYYTIQKVDGGYALKNVKMATNPLLITFSSDGCEDVVSKVYLVNKF